MDKDIALREERDKIVKGLEETYKKLVIHKKQINSPLVILRDGKITEINPDEMKPTTVYKRK